MRITTEYTEHTEKQPVFFSPPFRVFRGSKIGSFWKVFLTAENTENGLLLNFLTANNETVLV